VDVDERKGTVRQMMHLSDLERGMIQQAIHRHSSIFPCGDKEELSECFTSENDFLLFWYNTEDETTHVMISEQPN
jgi:hypothetical protein